MEQFIVNCIKKDKLQPIEQHCKDVFESTLYYSIRNSTENDFQYEFDMNQIYEATLNQLQNKTIVKLIFTDNHIYVDRDVLFNILWFKNYFEDYSTQLNCNLIELTMGPELNDYKTMKKVINFLNYGCYNNNVDFDILYKLAK